MDDKIIEFFKKYRMQKYLIMEHQKKVHFIELL